MISEINVQELKKKYKNAKPFDHVIIDNFWKKEIAEELEKEISNFMIQGNEVSVYDNIFEKKITCNHYDNFPKTVYQAFSYLNSSLFVNLLSEITGIKEIITDIGLHGGGLHIHPNQGKLNVHKDYSIHPKLGKERRLNIIIYMTPNWNDDWGGSLELWSHNYKTNKPHEKITSISNIFNRAILFDTTQNSWHGLPEEIKMPPGVKRQSMAVYFLTEPRSDADKREKALFAPTKEQENNEEILELIKKRAGNKFFDRKN